MVNGLHIIKALFLDYSKLFTLQFDIHSFTQIDKYIRSIDVDVLPAYSDCET